MKQSQYLVHMNNERKKSVGEAEDIKYHSIMSLSILKHLDHKSSGKMNKFTNYLSPAFTCIPS
ncbi:hypothetical protein Sjap_008521 [Stephania japonica]|uniref:Uncharacterized protein n=1 Tax=Stephania japonica TaxID=461633 RepID=A0AAP0JS25_9MAGN